MGNQYAENSQIQEEPHQAAMNNERRQNSTLEMSQNSKKIENKNENAGKDDRTAIRVVPIVMHDGKVIGGENKLSDNKTEYHCLQSNRKFETTNMQVESNMHVGSSEIRYYGGQDHNLNADNKKESTTKDDSAQRSEQKASAKYNQVHPTVKNTKFVQKSKVEARSKSSDREQKPRGKEPNESSINSYIHERDHSLQDLQREVQSIRQSIDDLKNYPNGYKNETTPPNFENEHFKKQTYRSSTLPPRSKTPTSLRNSRYNSYNSPQTSRKSTEQFPPKHYGPPVGHSSVSMETLNSKHSTSTPHFGFFPKPETRPGSITPAYVKPTYYRSARNLTRINSEQNKETPRRYNNYSEPHINYCTLPRMQKNRNKSAVDPEQFQSMGNKYFDDSNKDSRYEWINFRGRGMDGNIIKEGSSGREINIIREKSPSKSRSNGDLKSKIQKESNQARRTGTVQGVPRKQSNLDELNPFLVEEEDEDGQDDSKPSATDEYWATLNKKTASESNESEELNIGSDMCTQTEKNGKKSRCAIM